MTRDITLISMMGLIVVICLVPLQAAIPAVMHDEARLQDTVYLREVYPKQCEVQTHVISTISVYNTVLLTRLK